MPDNLNHGFSLEDWADKVLQAAKFSDLPPEARQEMKEMIAAEATARLGLMALAELDAAQAKEYEALARLGDDGKVFSFVARAIKDFPQKVSQTLAAYAEEFTAEAAKTKRS